jgi:hypothetical protein
MCVVAQTCTLIPLSYVAPITDSHVEVSQSIGRHDYE